MNVINCGLYDNFNEINKLILKDEKKYLFLFRHGETNWNVEKKIKGHLSGDDTFFTKKGYKQIDEISNNIIKYNIEAIFSSDLNRTYDTSMIIKEKTNMSINFCKELEGLNIGIFQGGSYEDFHKNPIAIKSLTDYSIPFPNGESINDLIKRLINYINHIFTTYNYHRVAAISHGAAISNVCASILSATYKDVDYCIIEY